MTEKKKEPDFVVTDRRKFNEEGERRPEVPEAEPASNASTPPANSSGAKIVSEKFTEEQAKGAPQVATEAEQKAQNEDYRAGSKRLDDLIKERSGGGESQNFEMTFE